MIIAPDPPIRSTNISSEHVKVQRLAIEIRNSQGAGENRTTADNTSERVNNGEHNMQRNSTQAPARFGRMM